MCVQDLKARGTPDPVLGSHLFAALHRSPGDSMLEAVPALCVFTIVGGSVVQS